MEDAQNDINEEAECPPEIIQDPSGDLTQARERPGSRIGAVHLQGQRGMSKMAAEAGGLSKTLWIGEIFGYLRNQRRLKVSPVLQTRILMTRKRFLAGARQKDACQLHGLPCQREFPVWNGT